MATHDDSSRLLHRATRDLRAPMALLVVAHPRRQVVDHQGFDDAATLRALVAIDPHEVRVADEVRVPSIRSWVAAPVEHEGTEVGTLLVADRRRRWFDDEEVRHLGLMSFVAARLIATMTALDLDTVDVREERTPVTALV